MITRSAPTWQTPQWQRALSDAFRDAHSLLQHLQLSPEQVGYSEQAAKDFRLLAPASYVANIKPGDPCDPLLRQILPVEAETHMDPGFSADPVGDRQAEVLPGVLHKYRGRALLITTGSCAVHCRYCFRRHYPYSESRASKQQWAPALQYIADDPSIHEVILSGGDPLSLNDRQLSELSRAIAKIPHVKRLRLHTRVPIVLPERVDQALLDWLQAWRGQLVIVVHANHAREISPAVAEAMQRLQQSGAQLLNQAVFLAGVNDDIETQQALSETLISAGVLPYYLHLLDKVSGAAHFDISEARAIEIHQALQKRLPGYLVPRLVREVSGDASKRPVSTAMSSWSPTD